MQDALQNRCSRTTVVSPRRPVRWRSALLAVVAPLAIACDPRRVVGSDPATLALTVRVVSPPELATAAARLGWPGESVPGALVVVQRLTPPDAAPDSLYADTMGVALFRNRAAGDYAITAIRTLTEREISLAGDALGDETMFTARVTVTLDVEEDASESLRLVRPERGSLLVSELAPLVLEDVRGVAYRFANYLRIHNNADSTISLANVLFVSALPNWRDYSSANPVNSCSTFAPLMRDPGGIWAQRIYRFPPDARSLQPGESALAVTDAIDHRRVAPDQPGFHDFSMADFMANFEFIGRSDVDNPAVPNVISVGPYTLDVDGHGWIAYETSPIYGLAAPLALDTLPRQFNAIWSGGSDFVRIPKTAVLDVLSADRTQPSLYPACPPTLLPSLDAETARLLPGAGPYSLHRRVARTLRSGRAILQRTRDSAADWYLAPMTPFQVP